MTVVKGFCHTHTGNEASSCVGGVVERLPSLYVYFGPGGIASGGIPVATHHLAENE